jgi:hypothetical protein
MLLLFLLFVLKLIERESLMNYKKYYSLLPLLFVLSLNVNAEEYKNLGNMTDEEYQKVREARFDHMECMNETAISLLETQNDVRVVADHAMKKCSPILEDLYHTLVAGNYPPESIKRFVSSISNKSANKILSKLMMHMAGRGQ